MTQYRGLLVHNTSSWGTVRRKKMGRRGGGGGGKGKDSARKSEPSGIELTLRPCPFGLQTNILGVLRLSGNRVRTKKRGGVKKEGGSRESGKVVKRGQGNCPLSRRAKTSFWHNQGRCSKSDDGPNRGKHRKGRLKSRVDCPG